MSLPRDLSLETNKDLTNFEGLTLRQTEKGLVLHTTLLNFDKSPYDLTNKKVIFNEHKDNEKYVVDDSVAIEDKTHGIISYKLHDQVYAAKGTAWFEIQNEDGSVVDSTQNFIINVKDAANASIYNSNYVPALERLRDQMQNLIDQAQKIENDQTTKFTQNLTNNLKNAQTQLNTKLTSMQQAYDNLENQRTSAFNTSQDNRQNTFNQSEKSRSDTYTQDKTKRDADWTADKARIDKDWSADKARIDGEWQTKKATLDSTIADLSKKLSDIQTSLTDLSNTKLPAMNKYADDVQKKVTQLKADFNAIDFSSYAKIADVYTKKEVDQKVASAGKVKTVDGQQPDANGNIYSTNLVSNGYNIAANTATNAVTMKSNSAWLTGTDALKPFADAINQLQGTGPNRVGTVDLNVLQGITNKVTTYICTSSDNKNTPPFFVDKRGILICFNYDGNAKTQVWIPVGGSGQQPFAYRYWEGNNYGTWKEVANSEELNTVRNIASNNKSAADALQAKTNVAAPLFRETTNSNNWQDILGVANPNQILVSIRNDHGGSGVMLGNDSSGIAFGGGNTKGVLNVSYGYHNARIIGGNGNAPVWHEDIAWKSDITNVNNRINELNAKMPDIHAVNSEAEGNAYLASHPNAIIMVKG